mmetsp:Transcript_12591/g.18860  ORF Transcript_12591/g.18860 Transcript_12591/m.18860 type:complete len:195 (+) Transcript_12591:75-659(+)
MNRRSIYRKFLSFSKDFSGKIKTASESNNGELFKAFVKAACALHLIREYIGDVSMLIGPSMLPTINTNGDVVLLDKTSIWLRDIKNGDVVIADSPRELNKSVCKRVRAMEGENVKLPHRYSYQKPVFVTIPKGHVWLEGDNKENSLDSRNYGPVPQALIRGRVWFKIWPPSEFGRLSQKSGALERSPINPTHPS